MKNPNRRRQVAREYARVAAAQGLSFFDRPARGNPASLPPRDVGSLG